MLTMRDLLVQKMTPVLVRTRLLRLSHYAQTLFGFRLCDWRYRIKTGSSPRIASCKSAHR